MAESTFSKISWTEFRPDQRRLTTGAALTGAGMLVSAAGVGLLVFELVRAGRSWTGSWEVSPGELASRTLHQAQTAAQAGRDAWRTYEEQAV
ncbi:hypothetical protein ACWGDS_30940 [Streptomyces sp. NPDC055059]|jgi:hypothetical protein|uniref:Uncharacterized protein n=1 Tax=Streptomyces sp. NBC_00119 TaxID=2975659 RepID=A0AAU1UC31_9ACTN|nr:MULTISPECIES: hypothetical protein [unclassified Streptomyces]MCX4644713.1 hypothetical protein [Streptomyces sp. NBC_01446]MCX5326632.1 hypothetical protein [Streptomyces sp. NBC_00120]